MNIPTCLFALIALAAVIFIHNLFLLRRCERLRHGQRCWKALSEANYQEAEELEGMLRRERTWRTLVNRRLNAALDARNWLITQIWGSPTIVRDLPDVYALTLELRDRLAASEEKKAGLASVVQAMNTEREALLAAAGRWQDQARDNAQLLLTLIRNAWAIRSDAGTEDNEVFFRVCDTMNSMKTLASAESPEAALAQALQRKAVQEAAEI